MSRPDPLHGVFDDESLRRRTLHGASATAVAQLLKFGLQMGTQVTLARLLDPAQFGLVAMVMPVLGFVMALNDFGLGQAIVQRRDITDRQVTALFWLNLAIGVGFTVIALLAAPLIAALYREPRTLGLTLGAASLIVLSSLSVVPLGLLNRQMRFIPLATIEVTAMAAGLATGIVAALHGAGPWSLVLMQAVNSLVTMLAAWGGCGWRPGRPRREPGVGALMRFGTHMMGSNLASYLSTSADNVIVGVVAGKVQLGLYDRSYNLVVKPLWQLMAPTSRVAIPLLSRLQDSPDRYGRAYLAMLQVTTALCVPGLVAAMAIAAPLIGLLLGPQWVAMVPVFRWVCFGGLAASVSTSCYWLLMTQNRSDEQVRLATACALLSIASFALGAFGGAVGVAMASALCFFLLQTPMVAWAATRKGAVTLAMLLRGMAPLLVASLACGLTTVACAQAGPGRPLLTILTAFFVSYGTFALTLLAQPAGRRLLSHARASLMPRATAA